MAATMQLILLENVPNLGRKHDVVNVKPGYGRNYLVPEGLAEMATPGRLKSVEKRREKITMKAEELKAKAEEVGKKIEKLGTIVFKQKVSDKGHLFAALHEKDIIDALKDKLNIELEPSSIQIPEPIKEVKEYEITIQIGEVTTPLKVNVEKEE